MALSLDELVDTIAHRPIPQSADEKVRQQSEPMNVALWRRHLASDTALQVRLDSWPASITRQDLLEQAKHVCTPGDALTTYTRIAAWGTGNKAQPVWRATKPFADPALGERLLAARDRMRVHGPVEAYWWMLSGGALATPYLGPAFFSKWLYFCDYPTDPDTHLQPDRAPALILDKRVKDSLGLASIYSHQNYATYLRLASEAASRLKTTPHVIESSLFHLRQGGYQPPP